MSIRLVFNSKNNKKITGERNINIVQSTKNMSTKPFPEKGLLMDLLDEKFKMTVSKRKEMKENVEKVKKTIYKKIEISEKK